MTRRRSLVDSTAIRFLLPQRFSFGLNTDYEWGLTSEVTAFVGGSLRYSGNQRGGFRSGNEPQRHIPDYTTVDLRAGAEFGQFTLEAYARNIFDTQGITELSDGLPLPGGAISAAFTQPTHIRVLARCQVLGGRAEPNARAAGSGVGASAALPPVPRRHDGPWLCQDRVRPARLGRTALRRGVFAPRRNGFDRPSAI